jgi:hypothetical protein
MGNFRKQIFISLTLLKEEGSLFGQFWFKLLFDRGFFKVARDEEGSQREKVLSLKFIGWGIIVFLEIRWKTLFSRIEYFNKFLVESNHHILNMWIFLFRIIVLEYSQCRFFNWLKYHVVRYLLINLNDNPFLICPDSHATRLKSACKFLYIMISFWLNLVSLRGLKVGSRNNRFLSTEGFIVKINWRFFCIQKCRIYFSWV